MNENKLSGTSVVLCSEFTSSEDKTNVKIHVTSEYLSYPTF